MLGLVFLWSQGREGPVVRALGWSGMIYWSFREGESRVRRIFGCFVGGIITGDGVGRGGGSKEGGL
ncbi:MAG: hypothetical protein EA369_02560 [Bradymonadales bacterium]|nr:MAG: hypothetical protein EA369_02560 [Bradymonadales bacterium]